jgi:alkaline phosphatase
MPPSALAAARLLSRKSINGKYQSLLQLDQSEGLGIQMTHSLDSFITDSANSATALMAGKKSTVNALNAYTDSTGKPYDNARFETVFEAARRIYGAQIGIVTTAYGADATPAAVCTHTSKRGEYDYIIEQYLNGAGANHSWTHW